MQVEQIDRDAAVNSSYTLEGCMCEQCLGEVAEQFARHRHQARAEAVREIVAWLREDGGAEYYDGTTIATDIEAKFGGDNGQRHED